MKRLASRVADLEAKTKAPYPRTHRIIQRIGETRDQALDAYGRDCIGEGDLVIVNRIVDSENGG
jgi:hypothetical protein